MSKLFSTEQISKYHPDKFADQISDAILGYCLAGDTDSRVACECLVKGRTAVLGGEITSKAKPTYKEIVNRVAHKLGYKIDKVINLISEQSPEINKAVKNKTELCAGDQGIMFGYACDDTPALLPYALDLANNIIKRLELLKKLSGKHCILQGDAKTQVTVNADNEIQTVVLSACHSSDVSLADVERYCRQHILHDLPQDKIIFNPAGRWTIGGAEADCGLTGRKIVCDQYGGFCAVGGGAFSGKDPSKMDRSGAYMARLIACELLQEHSLKWCEVQLAYAIGVKEPVSIYIKNDKGLDLSEQVGRRYDLTPYGIISRLKLHSVDYEKISEGCHFRSLDMPIRAGGRW